MTAHTVQLLLRRLKKRIGMVKPLYAHAFRHGFAMKTLQWGLGLDECARAMGHRSTKATEIYRGWMAEESALDKIKKIAG